MLFAFSTASPFVSTSCLYGIPFSALRIKRRVVRWKIYISLLLFFHKKGKQRTNGGILDVDFSWWQREKISININRAWDETDFHRLPHFRRQRRRRFSCLAAVKTFQNLQNAKNKIKRKFLRISASRIRWNSAKKHFRNEYLMKLLSGCRKLPFQDKESRRVRKWWRNFYFPIAFSSHHHRLSHRDLPDSHFSTSTFLHITFPFQSSVVSTITQWQVDCFSPFFFLLTQTVISSSHARGQRRENCNFIFISDFSAVSAKGTSGQSWARSLTHDKQ